MRQLVINGAEEIARLRAEARPMIAPISDETPTLEVARKVMAEHRETLVALKEGKSESEHQGERSITPPGAVSQASSWIAVSERLPPMDKNVLIAEPYGVSVGSRATDDEDSREWLDLLTIDNCGDPNSTWDVTHWMELPQPPLAASDSSTSAPTV